MDMVFKCTNCGQELEVDVAGAGTELACPSCNQTLTIPEPTPQNISIPKLSDTNAAAREDKHFTVPIHDRPSEVLIKKSGPTLEFTAKDGDRKIRVKTIRHGDCVEVGRDRFDDIVTEFLQKVGQDNIVNITPITYSHIDLASRQIMADFGVIIVFKA